MAVQVIILPVLVIVGAIVAAIVYSKTKSWAKVGYLFQIIFALVVFGLATQVADVMVIMISALLGLGMLIGGILGFK